MTTVADLDVPKSKAQLKKVTQVRFTVLSPDEIRQMSVAEVYNSNTYENGLPVHNGTTSVSCARAQTPCSFLVIHILSVITINILLSRVA